MDRLLPTTLGHKTRCVYSTTAESTHDNLNSGRTTTPGPVSFRTYPRGGGCIVGYGRHSQRMTSRASWRSSDESPHFRYFVATIYAEFGSDIDTQRSVCSIICQQTYIRITSIKQQSLAVPLSNANFTSLQSTWSLSMQDISCTWCK